MMTKKEDYRILPPPDDADVRGEIVPVADIDGRDAELREEDYYYIRELYYAFWNDTPSSANTFSSVNFCSLISTCLLNLRSTSSLFHNSYCVHMKAGLEPYDVYVSTTSVSSMAAFEQWLVDRGALVYLADDTTKSPGSGNPIAADALRVLYGFMTQDMFRQVLDVSVGRTLAFSMTTAEKSVSYEYATLDDDNNVVFVEASGTIGASSSGGISVTTEKTFGVNVLSKYMNGSKMYYAAVCFPSSTVSADVTLSDPAIEAYALVETSVGYKVSYKHRSFIRKMTGSGTKWSVELLKREDLDALLDPTWYTAFNEWTKTSANNCYFRASVVRVFVRFSNLYIALQ